MENYTAKNTGAYLTVIIPAYNEESSISNTVNRIKEVGNKESWDTEIIIVNDGSTDKTSIIAHGLGINVIDHPTNGGYGLSIQHAIAIAKGSLVAITDADGTYPIEKLPELVKMVEKDGFDMAVGSRTGSEYRRGLWKYPARILFKWLAEFVAGRRIPDINSGLRVMKKDKLLPHYERTCFGFSFTTSITLIFFLNGYFVGYTPIPYEKRIGKSKVKHFRDSLRTAQIMVSVISFYNPLKLFLILSIFCGVFALTSIVIGSICNIYLFSNLGLILLGTIPLILSFGISAESNRLKKY